MKKPEFKKKGFIINEEKRGWISIAPMIIFLICLYIYPLLNAFIVSFQSKSGNWKGLSNYKQLLSDAVFFQSLQNTVIFTIASVVLHLIIGLGLALLLNMKLKLWVTNFIRGVLVLPWLVPTVVAACIWTLIYHPGGVLNFFLTSLHLISEPLSWLGSPRLALFSVILVNVWKFYPLYMITMLAGLKEIPSELYEAARVDGAQPYQSFFHITLPQLKGVIIFITLLDTVWTFRHFDLVYVMTGGGPMYRTELLATYIYQVSFHNLQFNYGSAITVFMFLFSIIFTILYLRLYREGE